MWRDTCCRWYDSVSATTPTLFLSFFSNRNSCGPFKILKLFSHLLIFFTLLLIFLIFNLFLALLSNSSFVLKSIIVICYFFFKSGPFLFCPFVSDHSMNLIFLFNFPLQFKILGCPLIIFILKFSFYSLNYYFLIILYNWFFFKSHPFNIWFIENYVLWFF